MGQEDLKNNVNQHTNSTKCIAPIGTSDTYGAEHA